MTLGLVRGVTAGNQANVARRQVGVAEREAERLAEAQQFNIASERRAEVMQGASSLQEQMLQFAQQVSKQTQELVAAGVDPEQSEQRQQALAAFDEFAEMSERQLMEAVELYNTAYPDRTINALPFETAIAQARQAAAAIGPSPEAINEQIEARAAAEARGTQRGTAEGTPATVQTFVDDESNRVLGRKIDAQGNVIGEPIVLMEGKAPGDDFAFEYDSPSGRGFIVNKTKGTVEVRDFVTGGSTERQLINTTNAPKKAGILMRQVAETEAMMTAMENGGLPLEKNVARFKQIIPDEGDGFTAIELRSLYRNRISDNPAVLNFMEAHFRWLALMLRGDSGATLTNSEIQLNLDLYMPRADLGAQNVANKFNAMTAAMQGLELEAFGNVRPEVAPYRGWVEFTQGMGDTTTENADTRQVPEFTALPGEAQVNWLLNIATPEQASQAVQRLNESQRAAVLNSTPQPLRESMLALFKKSGFGVASAAAPAQQTTQDARGRGRNRNVGQGVTMREIGQRLNQVGSEIRGRGETARR